MPLEVSKDYRDHGQQDHPEGGSRIFGPISGPLVGLFVVQELVPEARFGRGRRILWPRREVGILGGRPECNRDLGASWWLVQWWVHGLEDRRQTSEARLGRRVRLVAKEGRLGRLDAAEDVVRIDRDVRIDSILGLGVLRGGVQTEDTCNYLGDGGERNGIVWGRGTGGRARPRRLI